ncbi:MAG: DUF1080 domain-containing protein [Acidobacteria bacterium]|nr:DUF1080 domain-containing protein [Acidobacteriota bacterium]
MKFVVSLLLAALSALAQPVVSKEEKKDGFKPLFNRRNLRQWRGDARLWRVSNGVIVGTTDDVQILHNTFLIYKTKKELADFHLKLQVRLRNGSSGVQFRSEELPDFVARGLQADMAEGDRWGSIYDEKGKRGVIVNGWKGKAENVVKPEDWNDYEIICQGENITIKVNGLVTAELKDSTRRAGILALQLHRGPGMKVYFRKMRIKRFPSAPAVPAA